jgi:hypothetical protein
MKKFFHFCWMIFAMVGLLASAAGDTNGPWPRLFPDLVQRYVTGDTNFHNPLEGTEGPKALATGDLNGDGLTDVVAGNLDGSLSVLLAQPARTFSSQLIVPATGMLSNSSIRAVVVADFNQDGKPDVVAGDIASKGLIFLAGRGDGSLETVARIPLGPVRSLAAADFNHDNRLDLLVGCGPPDSDIVKFRNLQDPNALTNRFLCLLLGQGDGTFLPPRYLLSPGVRACFYDVAAADVNQDGTIDAIALDFSQWLIFEDVATQKRLFIFTNDGLANFTVDLPQLVLHPKGEGARAFCVGYVDEKITNGAPVSAGATLDLVVANRDSSSLDVFLNLGGLKFAEPKTLYAGDSPRGIALGDLDGDGLADLVVANRNNNTISVMPGTGGGEFAVPAVELPAGVSPREIVLADFDGDHVLDAAVNNRESEDVSIFYGAKGVAGFMISDAYYPTGVTPVSVVAADFNADHLPDLGIANLRSHDVRVRLNLGAGKFGPETIYAVHFGPACLVAGDVNDDGKLDLVVSCLGGSTASGADYEPALLTMLGRGDGTFAPPLSSPLGDQPVRPYYLRLGDLSGDHKLDIALGGANGSLLVFRNRGDGIFEPGIPIGLYPSGRPLGLALGDFDEDGRLDIATSRGIVFLNDSQFFDRTNALANGRPWSGRTNSFDSGAQAWATEAEDLDNDGHLDLIVALTFRRPDPIAVLFGKGNGAFFPPKIYEGPDVGAVALWGGDIDGDGLKDIVIGNRCAATVILLKGVGNREFTLREIVRTCSVEHLAVADFNQDGKPDLVGVGFGLFPILNGDTNRWILPRPVQTSGPPSRDGLFINEIMSLNEQFLISDNATPDWVELYNCNADAQSLTGCSLSQIASDGESKTWTFPPNTSIGPWGHLVVFCDRNGGSPGLCAPFNLSSEGESLVLSGPGGQVLDQVAFPPLPADVSYARFADGARFFCFNPAPTLGSPNLRPANLLPTVERRDPYVSPGATSLGLNARVFDDVAIAYASLVYHEVGTTNRRVEIPLSDDGGHGDKLSGDGYYGTILPSLPPGTVLEYFFRAIDLEGQITTNPQNHDDPAQLHRIIVPAPHPALRLTEAMADNRTGLRDERGQCEDWLEIMNTGSSRESLDGLALAKDYYHPESAWPFPANYWLNPGERLVIYCDDDVKQGPWHATFGLLRDGDRVFLLRSSTNSTIIDSLDFGFMPADVSFGVLGTGGEPQLLAWPTPGDNNWPWPSKQDSTSSKVSLSHRLVTLNFGEATALAFRWRGNTNANYRVEGSDQLTDWTEAFSLPVHLGDGIFQWISPPIAGQCFYRVARDF